MLKQARHVNGAVDMARYRSRAGYQSGRSSTPRLKQVGPGVGPTAGTLTGQAQGLGESEAPTCALIAAAADVAVGV